MNFLLRVGHGGGVEGGESCPLITLSLAWLPADDPTQKFTTDVALAAITPARMDNNASLLRMYATTKATRSKVRL